MTRRLWIKVAVVTLLLQGCETHLAFLEADHIGLKVKLTADGTAPADVDLGMSRAVVAFIPQVEDTASGGKGTTKSSSGSIVTENSDGANKKVVYTPGSGELTSMYSRFEANIGLFDPFEVKHFLATGTAAENLAAAPHVLEFDVVAGNSTNKEEGSK